MGSRGDMVLEATPEVMGEEGTCVYTQMMSLMKMKCNTWGGDGLARGVEEEEEEEQEEEDPVHTTMMRTRCSTQGGDGYTPGVVTVAGEGACPKIEGGTGMRVEGARTGWGGGWHGKNCVGPASAAPDWGWGR